ncbi:GDP-mannose transporter [Vairimorpha necatrix]|uniref:GDP-mannose transporter n=1 Tax=Vairimorpha necatrix TaxID=6039 RepID=A0AAX4JF77_9MICR
MNEQKFDESVGKLKKSVVLLKDILLAVENKVVDKKSIDELKECFKVIKKNCLLSLSYMLISLATTILNKYIISVLNFSTPFFLVVCQSFIICFLIYLLNILQVFKLRFTNLRKWIIPSSFLCVMIFSGSKSLQYLDISFYTLIKNSSIFIVAIVENVFFNRLINLYEGLSFILMIMASYYNIFSTDINGLLWISINVLSTTIYIVTLRHILTDHRGDLMESIFYPNFFSIFLIGILSLSFESLNSIDLSSKVVLFIIFSSICALLTALTTAQVLISLSSTTYSMLGAMNKILLGFTGFIFVGESINTRKIYSLSIGILSTVLYTYSQTNKKNSI